jgi:quinoprotein glucose dehydrogenase
LKKTLFFSVLILFILYTIHFCYLIFSEGRNTDWPEYLGGPDRNHYSKLSEIDTTNVHLLEKTWEYHTGDSGQMQFNPIVIDGVLYGISAKSNPFALNAHDGSLLWKKEKTTEEEDFLSTSRGIVYWESRDDKRILYTKGSWIYALNAETGNPILTFGESGRQSLKIGLGQEAENKMVISNTPGTVYKDLIIMPLRVSEGNDAAMGYIQAFHIPTGKLVWVFKTIPSPNEDGYATWPAQAWKNEDVGGANNWAGMAIDSKRGIIYVPTGSAAFDFYGGNRLGSNLFANTLLALDAATGRKLWHFQITHHDILDRDPPAPPNLLTLKRNGKEIDAVAQITKHGYIYVFDRINGTPLFPIEEVKVPASDIPGEEAWPTQPIPTYPKPFARVALTAKDINPWAENYQELVDLFNNSRYEGPYTPLSSQGSIVFPGLDGGAEWGGAAVDPSGVIYINSNEMAWRISLQPAENSSELTHLSLGEKLYRLNCSNCHGKDQKGNPLSGYPALQNLKLSKKESHAILKNGKGMMPAFPKLSEQEREAILDYLTKNNNSSSFSAASKYDNPIVNKPSYQISGYNKFLDVNGYPAIAPPWGTLNAIDLNTGKYLWKIPYGEYPELIAKGIPQTGSESYGGPIVTGGGLLFIAGTKDQKFRAYSKESGKLLWETVLPAAGFATPSTYSVNGKQYVVIAAGGSKLGAKKGDSIVAFSLPKKP